MAERKADNLMVHSPKDLPCAVKNQETEYPLFKTYRPLNFHPIQQQLILGLNRQFKQREYNPMQSIILILKTT